MLSIDPLGMGTTLKGQPPVFAAAAADLLDDGGKYRLRRICSILGVEKAAFARLTHRRTESVAKLFEQDRGFGPREPRTREVMKHLVQLITVLRAMGIEGEAPKWMNTPLPDFDGMTPQDVLADGRGQELVSRLLDLATGGVGR